MAGMTIVKAYSTRQLIAIVPIWCGEDDWSVDDLIAVAEERLRQRLRDDIANIRFEVKEAFPPDGTPGRLDGGKQIDRGDR